MQYGHVHGIDKPISRLVQGCVRARLTTEDSDFALFDAVWDLGCNTFDTAASYGAGESEHVLGRWVAKRGVREKAVIVTKGAHPSAERHRVTPADITADVHDSLARLETDAIDLYLLHRDDPGVPVGPIVEVLTEHARAGRIRAFGGSNWTHERLREANEYARAHGLVPFAVGSSNFCLAERVNEPWAGCVSISGPKGGDAVEWYTKEHMPLFAWSSLAAGLFSGRFTRDNLDSFDEYLDQVCVQAYCYEDNFRRLDRAQTLAREKGLTAAQIALAYVFHQPMDVYALLGCRTGEEFRENLKAFEINLTPEEIAWLELRSDTP